MVLLTKNAKDTLKRVIGCFKHSHGKIWLFFLVGLMLASMTRLGNQPSATSKVEPRTANSILTLDYGQSAAASIDARQGDNISWFFAGSNQYVDITALAMTIEDYANFSVGKPYGRALLCALGYVSAYGQFTVPFSDTWEIVFYNNATAHETTVLNSSVVYQTTAVVIVFKPVPQPPGGTSNNDNTGLIIGLIVAVVVLSIVIVVLVRRRKVRVYKKAEESKNK